MNFKNLTNLNPDILAEAFDDLISLFTAVVPTLAPEARLAMAGVAVGDTIAKALLPVFAPAPEPVIAPAPEPVIAQPAPQPVVVQPAPLPAPVQSEKMTLADRLAAALG